MSEWNGETYDDLSAPQLRWGAEVVGRLRLDDGPDFVIADLGCGSGRVTEIVAERYPLATIVAADRSASMLAAARERLARFGERIAFVEVDFSTPFSASLGPLDALVSTGTFHWVPDHAHLFAEVAAMLKPGAPLVAQCGGAGSIAAVRALLETAGIEWRHRNRYADAAESAQVLADAGFIDISTWLHNERVGFDDAPALATYLDGAALGPYLEDVPQERRRSIVDGIAATVGAPYGIDFVRLNLLARRAG